LWANSESNAVGGGQEELSGMRRRRGRINNGNRKGKRAISTQNILI